MKKEEDRQNRGEEGEEKEGRKEYGRKVRDKMYRERNSKMKRIGEEREG